MQVLDNKDILAIAEYEKDELQDIYNRTGSSYKMLLYLYRKYKNLDHMSLTDILKEATGVNIRWVNDIKTANFPYEFILDFSYEWEKQIKELRQRINKMPTGITNSGNRQLVVKEKKGK